VLWVCEWACEWACLKWVDIVVSEVKGLRCKCVVIKWKKRAV
jgi:hypothetical protein